MESKRSFDTLILVFNHAMDMEDQLDVGAEVAGQVAEVLRPYGIKQARHHFRRPNRSAPIQEHIKLSWEGASLGDADWNRIRQALVSIFRQWESGDLPPLTWFSMVSHIPEDGAVTAA